MNDTHGVEGKGWYGFDLDGTLAKYDKWEGIDHIGEPVKPMVDLIREDARRGQGRQDPDGPRGPKGKRGIQGP